MNEKLVIEEFDICELEQRVEFGLCGGSGGGEGEPDPGTCAITPIPCSDN